MKKKIEEAVSDALELAESDASTPDLIASEFGSGEAPVAPDQAHEETLDSFAALLGIDLEPSTHNSSESQLALSPSDPQVALPHAAPSQSATWFLGLDLGTTGISAVLLNQVNRCLYPIYWQGRVAEAVTEEKWFRLPTRAFYDSTTQQVVLDICPIHPASGSAGSEPLIEELKASLGKSAGDRPLQPEGLAFSTPEAGPTRILEAILATLSPTSPGQLSSIRLNMTAGRPPMRMTCGAVGLSQEDLQAALSQLGQVILGCPSGWTEASQATYQTNVSDAILEAGLVAQADQIEWVDEAIAIILSDLPTDAGEALHRPHQLSQNPGLHSEAGQGFALAISAGAAVTTLAIAHLPIQPDRLDSDAIATTSIAYGGYHLEQDIICQMLYPIWNRVQSLEAGMLPADSLELPQDGANLPVVHLQVQDWDTVALNELSLPTPGQPDAEARMQLRQRLQHTPAGAHIVQQARSIKVALQHQAQCFVTLAHTQHVLQRQELAQSVLAPFVELIRQGIDGLLGQASVQPAQIAHIICSGGSASPRIVALWLRNRFPNATITQDVYGRSPMALEAFGLLNTCSRVAYGLATWPTHASLQRLAR